MRKTSKLEKPTLPEPERDRPCSWHRVLGQKSMRRSNTGQQFHQSLCDVQGCVVKHTVCWPGTELARGYLRAFTRPFDPSLFNGVVYSWNALPSRLQYSLTNRGRNIRPDGRNVFAKYVLKWYTSTELTKYMYRCDFY